MSAHDDNDKPGPGPKSFAIKPEECPHDYPLTSKGLCLGCGQHAATIVNKPETREMRMSRIAERFPTLRGGAGVRPWNEETFRTNVGGHGKTLAIQFVLHVWNADNPFSLGEARFTWDDEHWAAFVRFAMNDRTFAP
jgi:hypothetical protein